jgi:predicted MFS family arabinose efflux permease
VLDIAIVNVALPSIQQDLGIEQSTLQWIVIAYGLMLGGFLLLGDRMADLLGRRRMLLTGLNLFSSASLLAGVAGICRAPDRRPGSAGLWAALLPPAALSILAVTFAEGAGRNRALGIYGAVAGISASVGVIASGLLTDGPGWRWVFFINVPVDARTVRRVRRDAVRFRADRSAVPVTAGAGSSVRNRTLVAMNLSAFFTFGAVFSFIFLGSLLMQQVLGYSPTRTGVAWLATSATSFMAAAITGAKLVAVVGVRRLLVAGLSLLAISALFLTRVPAGGDFATDLLPALLLAGVAGGLSAPSAQIGAVSTVLVSRAGEIAGAADPAARGLAANAFHAAFWVMFVVAALGALTAAIAFRGTTQKLELESAPSHGSIVPEPTEESD